MSLPASDRELLLLHNPRCSKSRAVLQLLTERGEKFEVRRYLDEPLTRQELSELETRLDRPIADWVRSGEAAWSEAGTDARAEREELLSAVAAHPILMERPIVVRGTEARVGRPPERVLELFD